MPLAVALALLVGACQITAQPPPVAQRGLLVMNDASGNILTVRDDGTGKTVLPTRGGTPSWTPDGRIIFVSPQGASPSQVWIMDADGGNAHQIGDLHLDQGNPIVKPQMARNGIVVFSDEQGAPTQTQDHPGPQNGTWIMQLDGSGLRLLASHCTAPSLALSGLWLTCTLDTENPDHREIWRINTDGSGWRQLTFTDDTPGYPDANASAISPDEILVAFFSGKESSHGTNGFTQPITTWANRNVAVILAAGGPRRTITTCSPVTTLTELEALPAGACIAADNPFWSPGGKSIGYDRGSPRPDDGGTWVVDLNGQNNRRLSPGSRGAGAVPMKYVP